MSKNDYDIMKLNMRYDVEIQAMELIIKMLKNILKTDELNKFHEKIINKRFYDKIKELITDKFCGFSQDHTYSWGNEFYIHCNKTLNYKPDKNGVSTCEYPEHYRKVNFFSTKEERLNINQFKESIFNKISELSKEILELKKQKENIEANMITQNNLTEKFQSFRNSTGSIFKNYFRINIY